MKSNVIQLPARKAPAATERSSKKDNFTVARVRQWLKDAEAARSRKEYADAENPNLRVRVSANLASYSVMVWDNATGARRRVALGTHRELTPDMARQLAAAATLAVRKGEQPTTQEVRESQHVADVRSRPVSALLEEYLITKRVANRPLSEDTGVCYRANVPPLLGEYYHRPMAQLTPELVLRLFHARSKQTPGHDRTGRERMRGSVAGAQRAIAALGAICRFYNLPVVTQKVVSAKLMTPPDPRRARLSTDFAPGVLRWMLDKVEGDCAPAMATELTMLLTACFMGLRQRTIQLMSYTWIDFRKATMAVPPEAMKNKRGALLPIPPTLLAILKARKRTAKSDLVFGTVRNPDKPARVTDLSQIVLPQHFSLHDGRKLFSFALAKTKAGHIQCLILMAHSPKDVNDRHYLLVHPLDELCKEARPASAAVDEFLTRPVTRAEMKEVNDMADSRMVDARLFRNKREREYKKRAAVKRAGLARKK